MKTGFFAFCSLTLVVFLGFVHAARADAFTIFDFTAGNHTALFGDPVPYSLFGQFSINTTTGTGYTSDFWVQHPGAANGEFKVASGVFGTGNNAIRGVDITGNTIVLTFAQDLYTMTPGSLDALTTVNFDTGFSVDNTPVGSVCIAGNCPTANAAENPAQLVPEPGSWPLLGVAMAGLVFARCRAARC